MVELVHGEPGVCSQCSDGSCARSGNDDPPSDRLQRSSQQRVKADLVDEETSYEVSVPANESTEVLMDETDT